MSVSATNAIVAQRHARLSTPRTLEQRVIDAFREPHPFARHSATLKPHPVPWLGVYAKRTLSTFGVLVPLAVVVFGWPFAARWAVDLSNRVGTYSEKQRVPHESHKIKRRAMLQEGPVRMEAEV